MGTKDFNALDLFICRWRVGQIRRHIAAGDKILDFGCGHQALFLRSVQKLIGHGIGLDYDATESRPAANLEIQRRHFTNRLEFPDGSFDKVTILAVLEHLPVEIREPLFAEFHRVLKDGGELLITTPTPASKPLLEFLAFRLKIISGPEVADHKHYYDRADLESLASAHGFKFTGYRTFQFRLNSLCVFAKPPLARPA